MPFVITLYMCILVYIVSRKLRNSRHEQRSKRQSRGMGDKGDAEDNNKKGGSNEEETEGGSNETYSAVGLKEDLECSLHENDQDYIDRNEHGSAFTRNIKGGDFDDNTRHRLFDSEHHEDASMNSGHAKEEAFQRNMELLKSKLGRIGTRTGYERRREEPKQFTTGDQTEIENRIDVSQGDTDGLGILSEITTAIQSSLRDIIIVSLLLLFCFDVTIQQFIFIIGLIILSPIYHVITNIMIPFIYVHPMLMSLFIILLVFFVYYRGVTVRFVLQLCCFTILCYVISLFIYVILVLYQDLMESPS